MEGSVTNLTEYSVLVGVGGGGWVVFFFKQKTAYEIGTGDWSSDVCSSDLSRERRDRRSRSRDRRGRRSRSRSRGRRSRSRGRSCERDRARSRSQGKRGKSPRSLDDHSSER